MSYILDAVRKADQERRENLTATAHSLGAQSHSKMPENSGLVLRWPGVIAGLLLINLAGWYWSSNARNTPEADRAIANPAPVENTSVTVSDPVVAGQTERYSKPSEGLAKIPQWQAPVDAQNAVRSLEFSFHVYADDAAKRTIIINGQRVAEKDRISQDLSLDQITNSGVILLYQNRLLVEVDILEQW